ncbi:PEGA domain-containing protein, partial [Candidatus Saccharibacteria bacterium]|nr:PEGA domain-containing protein [Candidatus Saccharibacteria bacterium]
MDFLDPKKKRAHHIQLMIGYVLVAIVIGLATIILVYGANGYGINTKTGQIVQNGLLFADSQPGGAKIFLNGKEQQSTTAARLILPSGKYSLKLTKDGYRDWSRDFTLTEQSIARYVYPFLFPVKPVAANLKAYSSLPSLITQSPDRKWLLVQNNADSTKTLVFDQYDTTTLDQATPVTISVSVPTDVLTNYTATSKLTEVEWSSDNVHVLLKHDYGVGTEFIIFNREAPAQSINVDRQLAIVPSQVSLRDKKTNQLYLYSQDGGLLQLGDVSSKTIAQPILRDVLAYKPYGKNLITYITATGAPMGQVAARVWDDGKNYKLNEFNAGSTYLIDVAQFQNHFYYADGSDTSDRINIYKDPLNNIKDPATAKALPLIALHNPGATKLKFSENTRFIGTEAGQNFAVYDIEGQASYQYPLSDQLAANMSWMDGHRFIGQSNGSVI